MNNCFPLGGRIVIVDDVKEEAQPILTALNKLGVPYLYYDGESDGLPLQRILGVRILFLDLLLKGLTATSDDKSIVAKHMPIWRSLVDFDHNGPLIVVIWSDRIDLAKCVMDEFKEKYKCAECACLSKAEYQDGNVERLLSDIVSKLGKGLLFPPFFGWENAVFRATAEVSAEIVGLTPKGQSAIQVLGVALNRLDASFYDSNADQLLEQFRRSTYLYAQALFNRLETETAEISLPTDYKLPGGCKNLDDRILVAKINTFLGFEFSPCQKFCTGAVRVLNGEKLSGKEWIRRGVEGQVLKKSKDVDEESRIKMLLCELILTPRCDIANDGHIFSDEQDGRVLENHQVLYGMLIPDEVVKPDMFAQKETVVRLHPFLYKDNKIWHAIFTLRSLMSDMINRKEWDADFVLKNELLLNLQAKAANELNRPGEPLLKVPR